MIYKRDHNNKKKLHFFKCLKEKEVLGNIKNSTDKNTYKFENYFQTQQ